MKLIYISNKVCKKIILTLLLVGVSILYAKGIPNKFIDVFYNMIK